MDQNLFIYSFNTYLLYITFHVMIFKFSPFSYTGTQYFVNQMSALLTVKNESDRIALVLTVEI